MSEAAIASTRAIRPTSAFNPKVVLGLLLFGAVMFFAMLYFIGTGNTGGKDNNGAAHAASRGLTGYAALVELLKAEGHEVRLSRNPASMDDYGLLVLTPPHYADAEEIQAIIDKRRYNGPTLVILPKWNAIQIPDQIPVEKEEGWVFLGNARSPEWPKDFDSDLKFIPSIDDTTNGRDGNPAKAWSGLGFSGPLADPKALQSIPDDASYMALVKGQDGEMLAAFLDDGGYYPSLDQAAGIQPPTSSDDYDYDYDDDDYGDNWGVIVVAEPDLLNNYGMADRERAELALRLVETAMSDSDLPIIFDLTQNGLERTQNLLTLAFTPPFLAATICLIIAMFVVGWRAFRRFGPPVAEERAIAFGKTQLVHNSGGFVLRTRRLHLLTEPYVEQIRLRIAHKLGLRHMDDETIDAALQRRLADAPSFSQRAAALHNATRPSEILRAAHALKSIERMLAR
ncbi:MAG: DUF4350 domain-containing protein [Sphingomonadaceae bacterium]|nr:DUF4350 domain-containing protein [Sphingomonadaceae bacterium]